MGKNRNLKHHNDWQTPPEFYEQLDKEFNFDFDPCPLHADFDGLTIEWGQRNFINPPYSRKLKEAFVKKGIQESKFGKLCVFILPVSTSTELFHDYIQPNAKDIRFVRGRLKFKGLNGSGHIETKGTGMHDSMIVIFGE
jgi:site-specific DNA-methyltransferase (adenine-specific)